MQQSLFESGEPEFTGIGQFYTGDVVRRGKLKGVVSHWDGVAWVVTDAEGGEWVLDKYWEKVEDVQTH